MESALAVLKEQLPSEVQPPAISSTLERTARLAAGRKRHPRNPKRDRGDTPAEQARDDSRIEKEIQGLREQVQVIDRGLEQIAQAHLSKWARAARRPRS